MLDKRVRRERAADHLQKTNDLAREAVGCMGMFGAAVACGRLSVAYLRATEFRFYAMCEGHIVCDSA